MGRISKGYGMAALVFGILELICGIIIFICALVLAGKISNAFSVNGNGSLSTFTGINYWWGGAPFIIPGILGIVTFFTKNACAATCHLIFNIFCFFAASACAGISALLYAIWSAVVTLYDAGNCDTGYSGCTCNVGSYTVRLGGSCSIVASLNSIFMAMAVSASMGTIVILICCYVNCVSLCNQEQDQAQGFVLSPQGGGMVNQTVPSTNAAGQNMNPPPTYQYNHMNQQA